MQSTDRWTNIIFVSGALIFAPTLSYALPVLDQSKFYAPESLFNSTNWSYTGTLPSSLDAGFRAKNIDDDFFGDSGTQYATGDRKVSTTGGATPSYSLAFRGEFEERDSEAWDNSLLDQSKGVLQTDIDSISFVSPGGTTVNEHPIPEGWRSLNGYANPAGSYAKFDKTFSLSRNYLDAGELGCPVFVSDGGPKTGHCAFTEAYFKGGANLQANLQGYGSIENVVLGTQSVNIDAKANRITTFKVNNDAIFSGEINGTASTFSLEEEKIKAVDFSFSGSFSDQSISIGANVQWDGSGDTSTFDASYVRRVEMSDYVNVGLANQYVVEVRDDPQLTAGLQGTDFYKAKVLASTSLSAIDATLVPVFKPLPSSRLVVKDASTYNIKSPDLRIPQGGFTEDIPIFLHFLLINDGSIDLSLDGFYFNLFDDDAFIFDDLLASLYKELDYIINPNSSLELSFFLNVPSASLNAAVDFLEGNALELIGSGSFIFSDIYGTRARNYVLSIPEPGSMILVMAGLFLAVTCRRRVKSSIDYPPVTFGEMRN